MANEQNLKIIKDSQMARRLQEKSVAKRKENQTFKSMLLLMLDEVNPDTGKTKREELNEALVKRAARGDTKAYEVVRDTCGEKAPDKVEATLLGNMDIAIGFDEDEQQQD